MTTVCFGLGILAVLAIVDVCTVEYYLHLDVDPLYGILILVIGYNLGIHWAFIFVILACMIQLSIDVRHAVYPVFDSKDFIVEHMNATLNFLMYSMIAYVSSELARRTKRIIDFLERDPLTKAHTLSAFKALLTDQVAKCKRYHNPFTIMYITLLNFPEVNEQLGKSNGDFMLKAIAQFLISKAYSTSVVARVSGVEFAILFQDVGYTVATTLVHTFDTEVKAFLESEGWRVKIRSTAITVTPTAGPDNILSSVDPLINSGINGPLAVEEGVEDTVKHTLYYYA
jgi:diguanylate cyclase (GGDEF)-like protein